MRKTISSLMFFLIVVSSLAVYSNSHNLTFGHIKSVTAITEVFGDGQKLTAVSIEYNKNIDNSTLSNVSFSVDGRTITKVYTNCVLAKAPNGINGKYVIIELSIADMEAAIFAQSGRTTARKEAKVSVTQTGDIMTTDGAKYMSSLDAITNSKAVNLLVDDFQQFEYKVPGIGLISLAFKFYLYTFGSNCQMY